MSTRPLPRMTAISKRTIELSFVGTVTLAAPTGPHWTMVSRAIPYPFRLKQVQMIFTDDALNLVRHYWLYSNAPRRSIASVPSGDNFFAREAPTPYFIGRGIIKRVRSNIEVPDTGRFILLHTHNLSPAAYAFNCSCIIEEL